MNIIVKSIAAAALLGSAMPALAKDPSHWVLCDGYGKSQKAKQGFGGLGGLLVGRLVSPIAFQPGGQAASLVGVSACDKALADPELDNQDWTRRTSLLKARAIHNIEAARYTEALTDVEAARASSAGKDPSLYYARSTGLSLDLVQAYALLLLDRDKEGVALALRAAEARPYAARLQLIALVLTTFDKKAGGDAIGLAERVDRLDPQAGDVRLTLLIGARRFDEAAVLVAKEFGPGSVWVMQTPDLLDIVQLSRSSVAAYVFARAKKKPEAEAVLAAARARVAKATGMSLGNAVLPFTIIDPDPEKARTKIGNTSANWEPVIGAAVAFAGGDPLKAQDILTAKPIIIPDEAFVAFVEELRDAIPTEKHKPLIASDLAGLRKTISGNRAERLKKITQGDLFTLLPQPETEAQLNGFSSQAGFGLKSTGFKSKAQPDGTTQIEFVGTISSPQAIGEMTLLRAAMLAIEAKKPAFVIEKRNEYTRYLQQTLYGSPVGARRFAGYKSELFVRFVDDIAAPRALSAQVVVDALKPIYVRSGTDTKK